MKVKYQSSLLYTIEQRILNLKSKVILFRDMSDLADKTQISRALRQLVKQGKIVKLGYGIFAKAYYSERLKKPILDGNPKSIFLETLTRLNISWELGKAAKAYNAGQSTQVPAFAAVKLKSRLRREIAWGDMRLHYE